MNLYYFYSNEKQNDHASLSCEDIKQVFLKMLLRKTLKVV